MAGQLAKAQIAFHHPRCKPRFQLSSLILAQGKLSTEIGANLGGKGKGGEITCLVVVSHLFTFLLLTDPAAPVVLDKYGTVPR